MITTSPKVLNFFQDTNKKINNFRKSIIIFIFSVIFVIGIISVKDYGTTNDEYNQRLAGFITLNYLGEKLAPKLLEKYKSDKIYPKFENMPDNLRYYGGTIIHTPMALMEIIFNIKDKKNVFVFKHYILFIIFFLGLIAFFNICKNRFLDWKYGIFGVLLLFISPRIFSNSFYNNLDIPFMAFLIISLNYGLNVLREQNIKNIIVFSFLSAVCIDIRIMGAIIPFAVTLILFVNNFVVKKNYKKNFLSIFSIISLTLLFVILTWPMLWENPFINLIKVFNNLANHPIKGNNFYLGEMVPYSKLPWDYVPVWIFVTTPLLYSFSFLIGIFKFGKDIYDKKNFDVFFQDLVFLLIILLPMLAIFFFGSNLYNGWRHMFFIYPCFIIFALIGINFIFKNIKNIKLYYLIQLIVIFSLLNTSYWMMKNHPHQYVYFNRYFSPNADKNFELDFIGASYNQNLKYLIKNEKKDKYYIYNSSETELWYPLFSLTDEDRLKFIETSKENAEYWITNYHFDKNTYDDDFFRKYEILNEIIIDGNKINSLLKLKK